MNINQLLFLNPENSLKELNQLLSRKDSLPKDNNKAEFSSYLDKEIFVEKNSPKETSPKELTQEKKNLPVQDKIKNKTINNLKDLKEKLTSYLTNKNIKINQPEVSQIKELKTQLESLLSQLENDASISSDNLAQLSEIISFLLHQFDASAEGVKIKKNFSFPELSKNIKQLLQPEHLSDKNNKLKNLPTKPLNQGLINNPKNINDISYLQEVKDLLSDANLLDKAILKAKEQSPSSEKFSVLQGSSIHQQNKYKRKHQPGGMINQGKVKSPLTQSKPGAKGIKGAGGVATNPATFIKDGVNNAAQALGFSGSEKLLTSTFSPVNLSSFVSFSGEFSQQNFNLMAKTGLSPHLHSIPKPSGFPNGFFSNLPSSRLDLSLLQNQLVKSIRNGLVQGSEVLSVRLKPAELGSIKIIMKKESEQMHLKLLVENIGVKEILEERFNNLKSDLAKENVTVTTLAITLNENLEDREGFSHLTEKEKAEINSKLENQKNTELINETEVVDLRGKRILNLIT